MEENNKLENIIFDNLIDPTLDLTVDYSDLAISDFAKNTVINHIPIVKSLVALVKVGLGIKELFFIKKLLTFIAEVNRKAVDSERLIEFQAQFKDELKYRNKVIELISVMNDRFISVEKSKILANIFTAYTYRLINWKEFSDISSILDTMNLLAIPALEKFGVKRKMNIGAFDSLYFLQSAGLILRPNGTFYELNSYGIYLYEYGLKANFEKESQYYKSQTSYYNAKSKL